MEKGYEYIRSYMIVPLEMTLWLVNDNPAFIGTIIDIKRKKSPPCKYLDTSVLRLDAFRLAYRLALMGKGRQPQDIRVWAVAEGPFFLSIIVRQLLNAGNTRTADGTFLSHHLFQMFAILMVVVQCS